MQPFLQKYISVFGKNTLLLCCVSISYTIFNFSFWRSTTVMRNANSMLFVMHFPRNNLEKNASFFQITLKK